MSSEFVNTGTNCSGPGGGSTSYHCGVQRIALQLTRILDLLTWNAGISAPCEFFWRACQYDSWWTQLLFYSIDYPARPRKWKLGVTRFKYSIEIDNLSCSFQNITWYFQKVGFKIGTEMTYLLIFYWHTIFYWKYHVIFWKLQERLSISMLYLNRVTPSFRLRGRGG